MQISYVEPLSRAWERMRQILFAPFDLSKWLVLGFSAWLAGLLGGGGGSGSSWSGDSLDGLKEGDVSDLGDTWHGMVDNAVWLVLLAIAVLLVVALLVTLLWISSRAKFIYLDNVVHNRAAIVAPWHRFRRLGNSLFWWRLGFVGACIVVGVFLVALIVLPVAAGSANDVLQGLSFAGIVVGVLAIVAFAVVVGYVALFLESFIVPIMYRFDLKTNAAWNVFLPWLASKVGWFLLYGLIMLVAAIAVKVLYLILCFFTCCIVLIPYVGTVIVLPVLVLFRAYSIEFLAQFDLSFDLFAGAQEELAAQFD